jgi:hypothetical protein
MPHLNTSHSLLAWALASSLAALTSGAHALEAHPGDAVAPPPGTSLVGLYAIHQELGDPKAAGRVSTGPGLGVDIGLLRLFHATRLGDWQVNPQMVLPYGKVSGSGALASMPSRAGLGDVSVMASVMLKQDPATRTSVYVLPGMALPTGGYDKGRLNLGENRHKYFLQLGGQTALSADWTLDGFADVTMYGPNADNPGGRLTQKAQTLLQSYLRYGISATTEVAVGVRHYRGGETSVAGVAQNNSVNRTAYVLTAAHWIDGRTQLMGNWGQDASYNTGFKTRQNLELRMMRVF